MCFLWFGSFNINKIHLYSWENMSIPKNLGGWGIKNTQWFVATLSLESFWKGTIWEGDME